MQLHNPYGWVLMTTVLVMIGLAMVIWRRRGAPGSMAALYFLGGVIIWSLGYALELFTTNADFVRFCIKIEYAGIVLVPASWLMFALEYTGLEPNLHRRWRYFLLIEPILIILLAWSNEAHHFLIQEITARSSQGLVLFDVTAYGPAFWGHTVYSYLMLLAGTGVMLRAIFTAPHLYQPQGFVLLAGVFTPWIGNVLYLMNLTVIDPTPLAFAVTGATTVLSLTRFQLFDIVPVARDWVVDTMEDAVVVIDRSGRVIDANRAAQALLFDKTILLKNGRSGRYGIIGRSAIEVFERWQEQITPLLQNKTSRIEINLGSGDTPNWYYARISPVRSRINRLTGRESPSGRLLIFHDINTRKQAEELLSEARDQALQISTLKSQLIANVSHDLRTPLNAIMSYSDMLLGGLFGSLSPQQAEVTHQVLLSARHINIFVSDLLDQALIERGTLVLRFETFHACDLLNLIRSLCSPLAEEKRLFLHFDVDPDLPDVLFGDLRRLQQVLMNLVTNAIKYTDTGSVIVRLYSSNPNTWVIQVSDSGRGIALEDQQQIFEPYQRANGTPDGTEGTGLGLAIARQLVERMDGHIELQSAPGQGSTFRVILPIEAGEKIEK